MQQVQTVLPFEKKKRAEMTFGYLPQYVLPDLVPDMSGSAKFYNPDEIRNLMMQMDKGFVGMRRSTIDATEAVRQLILYTVPTQFRDGQFRIGVYQRAVGSDPNLQGSCSFGIGGHVEAIDLSGHQNEDESGNVIESFPDCPSSYFTTVRSGLRECSEEIQFLLPPGQEKLMPPNEIVNAILNKLDLKVINAAPHQGGEEFDRLRDESIVASDNWVILRDEDDSSRGLLVFVGRPVSTDVVYEAIFGAKPLTNVQHEVDAELTPCGFLSDYLPEQKGHVGNTHIAVIGVLCVPGHLDFRMTEEKYTTIGWMTKEELLANRDRFEAWSKILLDHLDELEQVSLESVERVAKFIEERDAERRVMEMASVEEAEAPAEEPQVQ